MEKKEVSFWRSVQSLPGSDILGWVTISAVVVGVGGGTLLLANTQVPDRVAIAGDFIALIAPLLGVVFAAFALVIALFSDEYLELLEDTGEGVVAFLRPFLVAIGLQVGTLLLTFIYRSGAAALAVADTWGSKAEVGLFLAMTALVVMALLDVLALAKNVMLHGLLRAKDARVRRLERESKAAQLDERRRRQSRSGGN